MKASSCQDFQMDPLFRGFCWDARFFLLIALSSYLKSSKKLIIFKTYLKLPNAFFNKDIS